VNSILQAGVEDSYRDFTSLVAKARNKTPEQVDEIGQGRVWDGGTARQLGLVDGFGGMDEALAEAAKRAKLGEGEYYPKYLDAPIEFSFSMLEGIPFVQQEAKPVTGIVGWVARQQKALFADALATAQGLLVREDVQALCLECGPVASRPSNTEINWFEWLKR